MRRSAIEQAQQHINSAVRAITEFQHASCYEKAETAWTDFIFALASVYSKFEQGAKGISKSEAWYEKALRKSDPVLRYLHYARNAEEHGIELATARHPNGGFPNLGYGQREEFIVSPFDPTTMQATGESVPAWAYGEHLKLVRAHNRRHNDYCDPPFADIDPPGDPVAVGIRGLLLIQKMLYGALELASPSLDSHSRGEEVDES